jgi:hypothetical protein
MVAVEQAGGSHVPAILRTEPGTGADALQPALLRRSGFQAWLTASVRPLVVIADECRNLGEL